MPLARKQQEMYETIPEERRLGVEKKKTFNFSRSKLPALFLMLLLAYLAFSLTSQFSSLGAMQRDIQNIKQEVTTLKEKNKDLHIELQQFQNDAYVEKEAREKLGLVKPGETRIVSVPQGTQLKKIQTPVDNIILGD
ncbi:MAG: septum formation initiator family protein [Eubacteriales bacterium]|nr:septum formation initiator family protein [Desulfotomaculaceae bacterium]MDD4422689.1 septum formation initiator family protein [Eubacteriales bacterium]